MSSIQIKELQISYKGKSSALVVDIPMLELEKGEIVGFFGPNRVGKTTLLKVIGQIHADLNISSRPILYNDKVYNNSNNTPLILYIPQDYNSSIFPWFSIKDNLRIIMKSLSFSDDDIEKKVVSFYKEFKYDNEHGLFDHYGFSDKNVIKRVSELSGGQRQTLTVLRAIMSSPDIILMDEPFSAIDIFSRGAEFRKKVFSFLRHKKTTTLIVSHKLPQLIQLTDKIIFFKLDKKGEGKILDDIEDCVGKENDIDNFLVDLKKKYKLN